jgi:REP element-mobilizing transposase RayT
MSKKEHYKNILPHFQQPGQAYFITWCLKDAIPPKALLRYTQKLETLQSQIANCKKQNTTSVGLERLIKEYALVRKQYIKAYADLLDLEKHPIINLSSLENTEIIFNSLQFWNGRTLKSIAFSIMPNHVHWVVELFEKDENGNPVYLQDVLQSVKRFTANQINIANNRQGALWQKESFDTTIRNNKHLYFATRYTINNPVKAGFVHHWREWKGTWYDGDDF